MSGQEKTRKQRKARFIRVKNEILRDVECGNGIYWCNHVYDPESPWQWVDFRFLSQRYKNRYYAVAAQTCLYSALQQLDEIVWHEADELFKFDDEPVFEKVKSTSKYGPLYQAVYTPEQKQKINERRDFIDARTRELAKNPVKIRPSIEARLDYGSVAIGLWVTLNNEYIDDSVVREFIDFYRSLNEPISHGIVWQGEEIEVIPAVLYDR